METDLSLIEISGEDDSLLSVQHSSPDHATSDTSYFSCSPLLAIPRSTCSLPPPPPPLLASPIESRKGTEDTCIPSSSSCEDSKENSMNQENVNMSKPEAPKLSLEPQQMKRKKKGGGYNLRKSLAWNRAFFTEEGVLDPLELSMLSAHSGKSSGEMLSVIHEGRESLCGELDSISDTPDLQSLEDNLSKGLPSSTPNKNRKIAAIVSPNLGSSPAREKKGPASAAKRKVLSNHDINRSASKRSGCPRPVASSYLKKSPNLNTTKVATKTSRVSKLLAPKPDPSVVSTTSRSSINNISHSRGNYISQPVKAQKNIGLKGTSTNTKSVQSNAKSALGGKSIIKSTSHQGRRNVVKVNSGPEIHSSSKVQLHQVSRSNNSSQLLPDSVVPSVAHAAKGHDSNTSEIGVSFSQINCFNGGNMQSTQPQPAKPSGLRMPSPSLGFFGQSKPSRSHNLLQRSTQCKLPDSNIPNLMKASAVNPFHQRPPRPSSNVPLCSSRGYSVASTASAASSGKLKSNTELKGIKNVALQVQLKPESFDPTNCKKQLRDICGDADPQSLDLAEPCKMLKNSSMEHEAEQSNNTKLRFQSGPCEQLEQDDVRSVNNGCLRTRDTNGSSLDNPHSTSSLSLPMEVEGPEENKTAVNQNVEGRQYDPTIKEHNFGSESQSAGENNYWHGAASEVREVKKQSTRQAELMKPDTCQIDSISNVESQRLNGNLFEDSRSSEDLNKHDNSNAADASLEVQECGATTDYQSHSTDLEQIKEDTTGIDYLDRELHVGDAQMLCIDGNLMVEVASGMNDMSEHACVKDKQLDSSLTNSSAISDLQPGNEACYRESGTSILNKDCFNGVHDVKEQSVHQVKLIASCSHEAEQQVNHSQEACDDLFCDENRSFKGVRAVGGNVCEVLHSPHQCETIEDELGGVDNMIKDTRRENAVLQFLDQNLSADSCNSNVSTSLAEGKSSLMVDDISRQPKQCYELQNIDLVIDQVPLELAQNLSADSCNSNVSTSLAEEKSSLMVDDISRQPKQCYELQNLDLMVDQVPSENHGLCSGDKLFVMNTSVDSQEKCTLENFSDTVLEQCDGLPARSASFDSYIQATPGMHDVSCNMDNNSEHPSMEPSIENIKCYMDCKCRNDELDNQASPLNFVSSSETNGDKKAVAANTNDCDETLDGSTDVEVNLAERNNLRVEAEIANGGTYGETQDRVDKAVHSAVKEAILSLNKSGNDKRRETLVIKPPPDAVPFSDEWLAAFEAAGEEILTMKSGAVQNSPQDKSIPEPGPWSPVKRKKNQGIGPFDCTKKSTTTDIPSSTSN